MATATSAIKKTMRLFGLPYQFRGSVDPRIDGISKTVGKKYMENIMLEAPVISIIPGKPKYLPGDKNKDVTSQAIIKAGSENFKALQEVIKNKKMITDTSFRYYDFERSYTEYMKYVNILCRSLASFLEINDKIDETTFQRYDWRNYRWNGDSYITQTSIASKSATKVINNLKKAAADALNITKKKKIAKINLEETVKDEHPSSKKMLFETTSDGDYDSNEATWEEVLSNFNYVQFCIDPDSGYNESFDNSTSDSMLKSMFEKGQNMFKELAFITNSGGASDLTEQAGNFLDGSFDFLGDKLSSGGQMTSLLSRLLSVGGNVVKGENVIIPDIYQSSNYDRSYDFVVHLKAPYGNKYCWFMEVGVPLMHLIALGIPKQTTANTYGSPFLLKAYVDGIYNCNLGIVSRMAINKNPSPESWTVDGLPSEIDVSVSITDLYSDLTMTPQSSPLLFVNNSSLIEYLATTCGLSLISPNLQKRWNMTVNAFKNSFYDIDDNIKSNIQEAIDSFALDFLGLTF